MSTVTHAPSAAPCAVRSRRNAGRALVTVRDVAAQELVLSELPSIVCPVPSAEFSAVCAECFTLDSKAECPKCKVSLCGGENCAKSHSKTNSSCSTLKSLQESFASNQQLLLFALGVLQMARYRKRSSVKVNELMSRPPNVGLCPTKQEEAVITTLSEAFSNSEKLTRERLKDAVGVIAINGVRVRRSSKHAPCVAVYPMFSMANHSCVSNASYAIHPSQDMRIELRTKVPLKKQRELTIGYVSALEPTQSRLNLLQIKWGFQCQCPRCIDPTELGTGISGLRCPLCADSADDGALILPLEPLEAEKSAWRCQNCNREVDAKRAEYILNKAGIPTDDSTVNSLECYLHSTYSLLGPNHGRRLTASYRLLHLYSTSASPFSRPAQDRLIQLCLHILHVASRVDPGTTRWRGKVLQDMVVPWLDLSKKDAVAGFITKDTLRQRVGLALGATKEAMLCLRFDPRNEAKREEEEEEMMNI